MRRHSWSDTGRRPEVAGYPNGTDPESTIDSCDHCGTERVRERGSKTLYLYRGGKAVAGRGTIPKDGWSGYTVIPKCVEREP
jgi:hypothetical protein